MPGPDQIIIREITKISEMRGVEDLQKTVWGVSDREVFPALALVPMIEVGAVLLGAFAGDQLIGFVFGFPGCEQQQLILHSDMLAVLEGYRSAGLGYQLKLAQREHALRMGIEKITWTFDPLQARNARLNFGKLGVIADSYRPDYYGKTTSFLHQSGTDRLWVRWFLKSERVRSRIDDQGQEQPIEPSATALLRVGAEQEPVTIAVTSLTAGSLAIEVPANINHLMTSDADLALRWRDATRAAFTSALKSGAKVTEFQFVEGESGKVGRYLVSRDI